MTRSGQHKPHRCCHIDVLANAEGLFPRHDVVVLGTDRIQWLGDAGQVDRLTANRQCIRLDQVVVQVHLAQIKRVHACGHARGVHVPEQHVKRWQLFTQQITVFHIVPDQAIGAQQPEAGRHVAAVKVAGLRHLFFQRGNGAFVNEHVNVARFGKVGECGEQRPMRYRMILRRVVAAGPGHIGRHQGATNAVASQVHLWNLANLAHGLH